MHRGFRFAAFALALAATPAIATAQSEESPFSFGASGGLSLPMGDLGDGLNTGFNITGHVFYKLASQEKILLRGDVTFDRFSGDDGGFDGADFSFRSLGFLANAMYMLSESGSSTMPYLIGGVGFYNGEASVDTDIPGVGSFDIGGSSTDFGLNFGAGIDFALSGFDAFAEARYHLVDGDGWIPITFGIRF